MYRVCRENDYKYSTSERPKRPKLVSAETEISAGFTETSAEISAEILPKITWKSSGFFANFLYFHFGLSWVIKIQMNWGNPVPFISLSSKN